MYIISVMQSIFSLDLPYASAALHGSFLRAQPILLFNAALLLPCEGAPLRHLDPCWTCDGGGSGAATAIFSPNLPHTHECLLARQVKAKRFHSLFFSITAPRIPPLALIAKYR